MQRSMKVRTPAAVIGLSIVTLSVYQYVWYYRVNGEMRDLGAARDDADLARSKPGLSVLALIVGALVVIPSIVSMARASGRIARCERIADLDAGSVPALPVLVAIASGAGLVSSVGGAAVGLVVVALVAWFWAITLIQQRLDAVWRRTQDATIATEPGLLVAAS